MNFKLEIMLAALARSMRKMAGPRENIDSVNNIKNNVEALVVFFTELECYSLIFESAQSARGTYPAWSLAVDRYPCFIDAYFDAILAFFNSNNKDVPPGKLLDVCFKIIDRSSRNKGKLPSLMICKLLAAVNYQNLSLRKRIHDIYFQKVNDYASLINPLGLDFCFHVISLFLRVPEFVLSLDAGLINEHTSVLSYSMGAHVDVYLQYLFFQLDVIHHQVQKQSAGQHSLPQIVKDHLDKRSFIYNNILRQYSSNRTLRFFSTIAFSAISLMLNEQFRLLQTGRYVVRGAELLDSGAYGLMGLWAYGLMGLWACGLCC